MKTTSALGLSTIPVGGNRNRFRGVVSVSRRLEVVVNALEKNRLIVLDFDTVIIEPCQDGVDWLLPDNDSTNHLDEFVACHADGFSERGHFYFSACSDLAIAEGF
jgi:hypothetical protein